MMIYSPSFYSQSCLGDLGQLTKKFKDIVDFGFDQLKNSAIKSRIKPMMEVLLSTSHNITEVGGRCRET